MADRTLLRNGLVLTCSGDRAERPAPADVLIHGERIARVSPQPMEVDRAATRVVDLHGATVLPALCDAHTHISWPLDFVFDHDGVAASAPHRHMLDVAAVARTFLESGYTLVVGAGVLQPDDDVAANDFIDRGLLPGPRIVPSGAMVTEPGALGADGGLMDIVADASAMRAVVARQCEAGVRAVKLFISGDGILPEFPSEDTYMNDDMLVAAVEEAGKYGAIVTTHARSAESIAMAARCGVQLIHHACFLDDRALRALEDRRDDVWVCPGLHYVWAMVQGHAGPWGMTDERLERSGYRHELDRLVASLRELHANGIRILAGGDFGHQWTHHGTYAAELERYVDLVGLSPLEALHTATRNAGPLVGLDWGEVRAGALADLLVLEGDPTADITLLQRPERRLAVLKGGTFAYVNPDRFPLTDPHLPDRGTEALTGVDALVRLLRVRQQLDERDGLATATMVSGYPGSPLGTFDLALEAALPSMEAQRVHHRPGLNEELAAATVWGSQMGASLPYRAGVDGVAGVWYGKAPGLDRSGDALKHGNAMGSGPHGGVVLFCGDDPTAKSSTLTCDSQHTFEDACIPVLYPADQQDVIDLGVAAFRLSRYAGCWVGLKIVTAVADGIGSTVTALDRFAAAVDPAFELDGRTWRHEPLRTIGPHQIPDQEVLVTRDRLLAAQAFARANGIDRVVGGARGGLGIVCAGTTYAGVLQALSDLGVAPGQLEEAGLRILKVGMTFPLVDETVLEFAASVDQVALVEEKRPFMEQQLRSILHEARVTTPVSGKRDLDVRPLVAPVGELDTQGLTTILTRLMPELAPAPAPVSASRPRTALPLVDLPGRPPAFCSGCPHNRSTVVPVGALVGGGVGCHGIMYFEARHQGMKSLPPTPMGAEGVPWIGLAPFVDEPHLIQNLGDGTLSHSGTLAIRASVAAGVNVTFKILYNAAVAMTGGQDVTGLMDVPSMTRALEAEGVRRIVVCAEDPGHYGRHARWAAGAEVLGRDRLPQAQERLRDAPGVSVIIYDQRCAAEARRLRKRGLLEEPPRRVVINEAVCEGCGDCSTKSNCLSVLPVATEFGEKRRIHDASCNRDYTCLEGDCPSFVTLTPSRRRRHTTSTSYSTSNSARPAGRPVGSRRLPVGDLPSPPLPAIGPHGFSLYFTGIGGTGVVTATRMVEQAAEASGLLVAGLDQTGLSQKAGAVVSHLRLAADKDAIASPVVGAAGADLYLSGDILQAAAERHLERIDPGRTLAVVDTAVTPTAGMLQTDSAGPDPADLERVIAARLGPGQAVFLDSTRLAESLFADHLLANVILLGAAYQRGGLPVSADAVYGITRGWGGSGQDNWEAFQWGRWAVHDPAAVAVALEAAERGEAKSTTLLFDPSSEAARAARTLMADRTLPAPLTALLERRAAQVVDYQHAALARTYLDVIERVAAVDDDEHGWALTAAVAESWFKLLTYKDEYEVARLHLKVDYDDVARQLGIEGPYAVTYHLHPPTLRRLGLNKKLPMGRTYRVAFGVLRRMKRLRGTPLDVFGWDRDRKLERSLVRQYRRLVESSVCDPALDYERRVQLAQSALAVKGYGTIKEAAVQRWQASVAELRQGVPVAT